MGPKGPYGIDLTSTSYEQAIEEIYESIFFEFTININVNYNPFSQTLTPPPNRVSTADFEPKGREIKQPQFTSTAPGSAKKLRMKSDAS